MRLPKEYLHKEYTGVRIVKLCLVRNDFIIILVILRNLLVLIELFLKGVIKSIINKFDNKYKKRITLRTLNKDNINIDEYNNLLTSKSFYEEIPTDTFLIFQTDFIILILHSILLLYIIFLN